MYDMGFLVDFMFTFAYVTNQNQNKKTIRYLMNEI